MYPLFTVIAIGDVLYDGLVPSISLFVQPKVYMKQQAH